MMRMVTNMRLLKGMVLMMRMVKNMKLLKVMVLMMRMVTKIKLLTVMVLVMRMVTKMKLLKVMVLLRKTILRKVCVWGDGSEGERKTQRTLLSQNFHDDFDHGEQTPTILILTIFYFSSYTLTFSLSVSP